MKKTLTLQKDRDTNNYTVYKCMEINGMYIRKEILPNPTPDKIKITLEVE